MGTSILVVEDGPSVRVMIRRVLEKAGYEVLDAGDARKAIDICNAYSDSIELLISDVILPGMGGVALAEKLKEKYPEMLILFMSGHFDDLLQRQGLDPDYANFIAKPFLPKELLNKVHEILLPPGW